MKIFRDVDLKRYNTFGLSYKADCLISIHNEEEAVSIINDKMTEGRPLLVIGGGSNLLFTSDFKGTILYPEIEGITIEEEDDDEVLVSAGCGVKWDDLVNWCVGKGFYGLENLSLIPGNVGATPVQNIGAYGVEIKESIMYVRTISLDGGSVKIFENKECEFGYRSSIFKKKEKGHYLITMVCFRLSKQPHYNLSYGSLKEEAGKPDGITLKNVRQSIINIRRNKLPDPELIGNAGSFFKNPVVKDSFAAELKKENPEMPVYKDREGYMKLASGWLIEQCGWKGKRKGDTGVHDKQSLVLVNYGNASGKDIYELSEEIKMSVSKKFGVTLEREVEVIGTI